MLLLLSILWFFWELKYVLFWLYLWQLKEYHVGRFADHFRTHKGKKLIFDFTQILKLFLLLLLILAPSQFSSLVFLLTFLYLVQVILFGRAILQKTFKAPVRTLKTTFLKMVSALAVILFLAWTLDLPNTTSATALLTFDILTPLIISVIVLVLQPFFVALRNNTVKKAGQKMAQLSQSGKLKVVAITGSYGKTTTKEFLATILSANPLAGGKVLSTSEHQNAEIGIAKCILQDLDQSHQIFIAEVGAYNKGKVKQVCKMLQPKIGIVTGVNEQHLALFGSMQNLLSAEGGEELANALPKDGLLVLNGENKHCLALYRKTSNPENGAKKVYSLSNKQIDADIFADQITAHKDSVSFVAVTKKDSLTAQAGEMAHFDVKVLGGQNVQNLLGAILVAKHLGMNLGQIAEACQKIKQEQAGMALKQGKHGIDVIDSSYSANPDGVMADLDYFNVFSGKKVVVMPCLIELGKQSSQIHQKLGKKIAQVCNLAIVTTKDNFKDIKKGAVSAGMNEKDIILCDKPEDIYSMITLVCKQGDAVLLEGRVPGSLIKMLVQ